MPPLAPRPIYFLPVRLIGLYTCLAGSLLAAGLVTGCSSAGPAKFGQGSVATAGLSQSNFRILKSNVQGDSYGFRLLGFIPIVPARVADAKADLYHKLDRSGVQLEGRSIALANATEDENHYYFIIGSVPRITLTADIVEFMEARSPVDPSLGRATEPMTRALVPSSILKPSALNSPPPSKRATVPQGSSTPKDVPPAPASSPPRVAPIEMDAPIAEFDIPPFGSTKGQNGSGPK
ncbi:hypothetical protein YTPLAS18_33060 [Nitrospira sp.]|nr:hypothetical protein YTPLAS18_33060 [Nitrospira sp.]